MVVRAPRKVPHAGAGDAPTASYSKKKKKKKQGAPKNAVAKNAETVLVVDWKTAAWFKGCESNLAACYSLLSRCFRCDDVETLASEALVRRAVALQDVLGRLRAELLPDEEESTPKDENGWTAQQILSDVVALLPCVPAGGHATPPASSTTVAVLEDEVVTAITELLLCRLGRTGLATLKQWAAHLRALMKAIDQGNGGKIDSADRMKKPSSLSSGPKIKILSVALADITVAIEFHRANAQIPRTAEASVPSWMTSKWTKEIWGHFSTTRIRQSDEVERRFVAADIRAKLHLRSEWARSQVLVLGSSLSLFGSKTSDLNMCVRIHPHKAKPMDAEFQLRKLRYKTRPERDYHELVRKGGNDDAATLMEALRKANGKASLAEQQKEGIAKWNVARQTRLSMLAAHWQALAVAVRVHLDEVEATSSLARLMISKNPTPDVKAITASNEALLGMQSQRKQDIDEIASVLKHNGCRIVAVVRQARVPVIKFVHESTGLLCDLCLENVDGYFNSRLLRTYAECDDRARALGMAIKLWAKRRGISDAASGHLSSYTFSLLTIFFLQTKAMILPHLQHPALLGLEGVVPLVLNGVNVSFCANARDAREFHWYYCAPRPESVGELLLSFFEFYVNEFDFSERFVSVRNPFGVQSKSDRWAGTNQFKAWRISIEDPVDVNRDLADVLRFQSQFQILTEMKRALTLLRTGASFEKEVCESLDDEKRAAS